MCNDSLRGGLYLKKKKGAGHNGMAVIETG